MTPIEKLNELSPSATSDIDYESPSTVEINSDLMRVQLRVDDGEIRRREIESKQALWVRTSLRWSSHFLSVLIIFLVWRNSRTCSRSASKSRSFIRTSMGWWQSKRRWLKPSLRTSRSPRFTSRKELGTYSKRLIIRKRFTRSWAGSSAHACSVQSGSSRDWKLEAPLPCVEEFVDMRAGNSLRKQTRLATSRAQQTRIHLTTYQPTTSSNELKSTHKLTHLMLMIK